MGPGGAAAEGVAVDALFAQTLADPYDSDEAWSAVSELHRLGTQAVFDRARFWLSAACEPRKRLRGVQVLSQLRGYRAAAYDPLFGVLADEPGADIIASVLIGLSHIGHPAAVPILVEARYVMHPDEDVRYAVAFALGSFADDSMAASTLLKLTADPVAKVRDWAVFGLGVLGSADSSEIRDRLLRCLDDEDADVGEEAMVGLARRRDPRVIPTIIQLLRSGEPNSRAMEAATAYLDLDAPPEGWSAVDLLRALPETPD